jgi:hypothetical protein
MSPRLQSLIRQREAIRSHLRWLDEEIAGEGNRPAAHAAGVQPAETDHERGAPSEASGSGPDVEATSLPDAPEPDARSLHSEVQRGCLLYAAVIASAFAVLLAWIYVAYD